MIDAVRRFSVVGTAGSGKTTVARQVAQILHIPHVEMDALYWGPNWTPAALSIFRQRLADHVSHDAWVVDGNYSVARDIVWQRAQVVVWLDYGLPVILWRLLRRTLRRSVRKEELWNGNRESLRLSLCSSDSILLWALQTHRRRRMEYSRLVERPAFGHLHVIRLQSPRSTCAWLTDLGVAPREAGPRLIVAQE